MLRLVAQFLKADPAYALSLLEPAARRILCEAHRARRSLAEDAQDMIDSAVLAVSYSHNRGPDLAELAEAYSRAGQLEKALQTIDLAILADENRVDLHRSRSELLTRMDRHAEAADALSRWLDLQPSKNSNDEIALAHLYAKAGQLDDALLVVDKCVGELPDESELLRFKASLLERTERYGEAYALAKQLKSDLPDQSWAKTDFARIRRGYLKSLACFWRRISR